VSGGAAPAAQPWRAGARELAAGRARAAHDAWEEEWRARRGSDEGEVLRALAQYAAALVHRAEDRERGCRSLCAAAAARLRTVAARAGPSCMGLDLDLLAGRLADFAAAPDPLRAEPPPVGSDPRA
jgi:predicted metal-dependent hydrolase